MWQTWNQLDKNCVGEKEQKQDNKQVFFISENKSMINKHQCILM
jgi:hypothetical protein